MGDADDGFSVAEASYVSVQIGQPGALMAWNNSAMYAGILLGSALGGPLLHTRGPTTLSVVAAAVAVLAALTATRTIQHQPQPTSRP